MKMTIKDFELLLFMGQHSKAKDLSASNDDELKIQEHFNGLLDAFIEGKFHQVLTNAEIPLLANDSLCTASSVESLLIDRVDAFTRASCDQDDNWRRQFTVLLLGAASLQLFVQNNWTGPLSSPPVVPLLAEIPREEIVALLSENEEPIYATVNSPEFLWLAKIFLRSCSHLLSQCPTAAWWCIRYVYVHQQILDERSPGLLAVAEEAFEKTFASVPADDETLIAQLYLEAFHVHLLYYNHSNATEFLNKALQITRLNLSLTGVLGKRTHFQQRDIAQLSLKVERESPNEPVKDEGNVETTSRTFTDLLPKDLRLNDEVRLETIKFKEGEELSVPTLGMMDQAVILAYFTHIKKTNPVYTLVDEELMTYLRILLSNPQNWSIQSAALLQRSIMESNQSRSVERSMMQIQALYDQFCQYETSLPGFRLKLIYCTAYPPRCILEKELARLFIKMGAIKSALDVYLRLQDWENIISCYHLLQRRNQAEAVIRQQLALKETPILWCYLGDATDNPEYYFKAWEMSNHRSARAQKSLGLMHFKKKEYETSIGYLEKSVELNGIQLSTWFCLAFAAMKVENWELAAKAYRRCINLEPDNYEAWNNLSNAYIKLKQKTRAWRTLQEALKCNYESSKIWENYLLVSVDCGAFSEVVNAYHRILDLDGKHLDNQVLGILVKATSEGIVDFEGKPATYLFQKLSELFGRLTAKITTDGELWRLYGNLISSKDQLSNEELQKVVQYYQKSLRSFTQKSSWETDVAGCQNVIDVSLDLANAQIQLSEKSSLAISSLHVHSTKLMLNSTISTIKQFEKTLGVPLMPEVTNRLALLQEKLKEVTKNLS